ncbi:MAG: hypothetical protein ACFHVJ_05195 [Aestuariibacter sp.]
MDEFSKKIEQRIKEEFPEWEKFCSSSKGYFEVKVPRPNNIGKPDLELETWDQEVTVFFGPYHIHCDDFGNNDAYTDALDFVTRIIANQVVIVIGAEILGAVQT